MLILGGRSIAVGCALVLGAAPASAHFAERQSSISAYVAGSELIVRGVIERSHQTIEAGHSERDGHGILRVEDVLKGDAPKPPLRFTTTGTHQPRYQQGEHVLLFLNRRPDSDPPVFLTRQNAIERVDWSGPDGPALLAAVREYVAIDRVPDETQRLVLLKTAVVRDLSSPKRALWENALFDLSKRPDLPLGFADVAVLEQLALDQSRESVLRVGCVAKLRDLGRAGSGPAAHALAAILASRSETIVRTMAAAALEETRSPAAGPALTRALGDSSTTVRRAAADGLGRLRVGEAVGPLGRVAGRDPNAGVRFAAFKALARIGNEGARETLQRLAENPQFPDTPNAIELARRQAAHSTYGRDQR